MAQVIIENDEYKELLKYRDALQNNRIIVTLKSDQYGFKYEALLFVEKDEAILKLEREIEELRDELNKANKKKGFFSLFKH
jgi:hypothetical protein